MPRLLRTLVLGLILTLLGFAVPMDRPSAQTHLINATTLLLPSGESTTLAAFANGQPTALVVIKGHRCQVCTSQLKVLAKPKWTARLKAADAKVAGLSSETTAINHGLMTTLALGFPVLADPKSALLRATRFVTSESQQPQPGVIFLNRCGVPVHQYRGRWPGAQQEDMILETLEKIAKEPSECRNLM